MTIKDIAKLSGYGIGTVSRVINNHPDVSEEARTKILKVIEESGYEPNTNARHLKMRAGSTIGIIIKGNNNMLFADIIERIQIMLETREEEAVVQYIGEDGDEIDCALRLVRDRNPKGFVFLGANLANFDERLKQIEVPGIVITTSAEGLKEYDISSICTDDEKAAYSMVEYLVKKGHTNIGLMGGKLSETQISFSRFIGSKKVFEDYNLPRDARECFVPCKYSMQDGYEATKFLLERNPEVTAIFAFSDTIALGAIRAIHDMGKRVPEDISVAGFDGIALSQFCVPRITTIYQNTEIYANRGVDILLKHTHYNLKGEYEIAPFQLIEGDSVKDISKK